MSFQDQGLLASMIIVIIPFVIIALGSMIISRKIFKKPLLRGVELRGLGTITSITGGLYGLLLGLVVVSLWQDYKKIQEKTIEEASLLAVIHSQVEQLEQRDSLQILIENYIDAIINYEWPLMIEGNESKVSKGALLRLALYAMHIETKENTTELLKRDLMRGLTNIAFLRKERLYYASTPRVPIEMWTVLIMGSVITISIGFLFPVKELKTQIIITIMHSSMIALIIFLIASLNYPFRGAISIEPKPFIKAYESLQKIRKFGEQINTSHPMSQSKWDSLYNFQKKYDEDLLDQKNISILL